MEVGMSWRRNAGAAAARRRGNIIGKTMIKGRLSFRVAEKLAAEFGGKFDPFAVFM